MAGARFERVLLLILDSVGCGALPDAADYGDGGSDTLGHTAEAVGGLELPNFQAAGLGNLHPDLLGVPPATHPTMAFGKLTEASAGKDSTTGHWELAGIITDTPTATFTDTGFPEELVRAVEEESGHRFIGNYAASGTVIIAASLDWVAGVRHGSAYVFGEVLVASIFLDGFESGTTVAWSHVVQ